jgi:protein CWC15
MSTAHRPTWKPKSGGGGLRDGATAPPTLQHSSKDQPAHKRLKYLDELAERDVDEHAQFFIDGACEDEDEDDEDHDDEEDEETSSEAETEKNDSKQDSDSVESSEESEDEEALLAELQRIRQERAAAASKKPQPAPLTQDGLIQKSWEEEGVVFRRKSGSSAGDGRQEKRFVNDTVRSDYHRAFMDRFVK